MLAKIAAANPAMDKGAKMPLLSSSMTASRNMMKTPNSVRTVSGRTRMYSAEVGMKLSSTIHLHTVRERRRGLAGLRGFQNLRVLRADRRQERLRKGPHPEHQDQQRNNRRPFARLQIVHVMAHRFRCLPVKHSLV